MKMLMLQKTKLNHKTLQTNCQQEIKRENANELQRYQEAFLNNFHKQSKQNTK
jgi:hypothetical protein